MKQSPSVGFVSLGCPKNLVDSERILTQLRAEGYEISPDYAGADLVIVNTCGFIDDAVEESLETIGEALEENGRGIVTGCLGVREDEIRETHPAVLAVTGPHAYEEVMEHVHEHLPAPHDPFLSLLPPSGVKLTPKHYAYLKISEGCNHRCSFCIIPQMRGDLVSRPFAEVMHEAENLVASGVRELLVVSQDTSAYGVDLKYRTDFWRGRPLATRLTELARELGQLPAWIRLHYVYPYPNVDDLLRLKRVEPVLEADPILQRPQAQELLAAVEAVGTRDRRKAPRSPPPTAFWPQSESASGSTTQVANAICELLQGTSTAEDRSPVRVSEPRRQDFRRPPSGSKRPFHPYLTGRLVWSGWINHSIGGDVNGTPTERPGRVPGVARAAEAIRSEWAVDRRVLPARGSRSSHVYGLAADTEEGAP